MSGLEHFGAALDDMGRDEGQSTLEARNMFRNLAIVTRVTITWLAKRKQAKRKPTYGAVLAARRRV